MPGYRRNLTEEEIQKCPEGLLPILVNQKLKKCLYVFGSTCQEEADKTKNIEARSYMERTGLIEIWQKSDFRSKRKKLFTVHKSGHLKTEACLSIGGDALMISSSKEQDAIAKALEPYVKKCS